MIKLQQHFTPNKGQKLSKTTLTMCLNTRRVKKNP